MAKQGMKKWYRNRNGNGNGTLYKKFDGMGLVKILFTNLARDDSGFLPACTVITIHNEIGISLFNSLVDQVVVLSFVVLLVNKIRLP